MATHALNGPAYLIKGLKLLQHPRIRLFVIAPLLINIVLFVALTGWAISAFGGGMEWLLAQIPGWLAFIEWLLWVLFAVLLVLVYGYTFAMISNLIASPFYGLLAERVAEVLTNRVDDTPMTLQRAMAIGGSALKREFIKLGYFLPRMIGIGLVVLVLFFIPLLNTLVPVVTFLWGSWTMAIQNLDYPADNASVSFPGLLELIKTRRSSAIGFGAIVQLGMSVPLVNLLTPAAAVAGGTAMWVERYSE